MTRCVFCKRSLADDKDPVGRAVAANTFCLSCVLRMPKRMVEEKLRDGIVTQDQYDCYYDAWICSHGG